MPNDSATPAPGRKLRAFQDPNVYAALGRAVSYLMLKPSFAAQKFGVWSRTLVGQINRKHYFFVTDGKKIVGFAGWALVTEERAKAWLAGGPEAPSDACVDGDTMIVNGWAADDGEVNHFVRQEMRRHLVGLKGVYAKRVYKDGRVRPFNLGLNDALDAHLKVER
jgi:hemolysin-activating ACP:hemolysin acyltransferase